MESMLRTDHSRVTARLESRHEQTSEHHRSSEHIGCQTGISWAAIAADITARVPAGYRTDIRPPNSGSLKWPH